MPLFRGFRLFLSLMMLITMAAISACSGGGKKTPIINQPVVSAKLLKPADDSALERWLKAELVKIYQYKDIRYYYMGSATSTNTSTGTSTGTNTGTVPQASDSAYSNTNVQEQGVDEGDLVKTDGNYIYLVRGSHFLVLKGQPAEQAAIVSDIDLQEPVSELHLSGNRVTLIAAPYNAVPVTGAMMPQVATTRVYNYDVATPSAPVLLSRFDLPGTIQGTRRINNVIYVITNHHIDLPSAVSAWDYLQGGNHTQEAYNQASALASAENLRRINALTLADMIPTYSRTIYSNGVAGATSTAPVVTSGDVYIPESGNGTDISLVIALDNTAEVPVVTSSGVISSWCRIYMSPESLYLASDNNWAWIQPMMGVAQPVSNPEPWTALHKFSLGAGGGKPFYKGSGTVTGWLNNQFSMGEYNGYLRIGTTRGGWWGEGISNRLSILAEQDGVLAEKGKIEGLAPGEQIYAMRFDRDRGYMVTFRQTDPLFTFDLSDPLNPRKAGEIHVTGFATYIHLLGQDNNRLLTVGRSADAAGRVTGNKLQLFDVSNLASPTLLGSYELGDAWSAAIYDHHAFLYYEPLSILAIPYYSFGSSYDSYSSGLRVFDVSNSGISQRGMIAAQAVSSGYGTYTDTVDRAVIIGADIYAIAHRSVTVAGAAQLDIKKVIGLTEEYGYYAYPMSGGGI